MKNFSEIIKNKKCLYRYRALNDNNIKALKEDKLYFSVPKYFNDPYDNLVFANSGTILSEIMGNVIGGMDEYLKSREEILDDDTLNYMKLIWSDDNAKKIMLENHKNFIFSALDTIRINIKNNTRIICFTENYDSMLMWSHYADYHKGYVLVYDSEDIIKAKKFNEKNQELIERTRLESVNYVEKQTDMTEDVLEYIRHNVFPNMGDIEQINASISSKTIRKIITEKSKEWSYEKEWRLIPNHPKIETKSELSYIECKPLAVIIGSQCQGENRTGLIGLCRDAKIPVFGIFLSETDARFKLIINDEGNLELA